MRSGRLYRWERRRQRLAKTSRFAFLDIFDLVILILVFAMSFISLRLLFTFEAIQATCAELILSWGQVNGNWPVFKICFFISLLMGVYWLCVTIGRVLSGKTNWRLIFWHVIMFIIIFFLATFNRSLVPSQSVNPPDGTLVVEYLIPEVTLQGTAWVSYGEPRYKRIKDGIWHTWGDKACVWLDEGKVSYNDNLNHAYNISILDRLALGRPQYEILKDLKIFRQESLSSGYHKLRKAKKNLWPGLPIPSPGRY